MTLTFGARVGAEYDRGAACLLAIEVSPAGPSGCGLLLEGTYLDPASQCPRGLLGPFDHQTTSAAEAVHTWHESGVTGIVAYNDDIAATVVGAAVRAGLTIPGDLAVIGHDDSPIAAPP